MSAPEVAKLEQENARLGVALSDAYGVLGKTKTALEQLQAQYDALKQQLDWFKRQLFGQKSEKRLDIDDEAQLNLLAGLGVEKPPSRDDVPTQTVTYERRAKVRDAAVTESGLRFGPEVPVQTIEVTDPAIETIPQAEREVIGEKVSYRLAQQPGSYVVLKYVRKVVKRRDTKAILTAPAPANVLERSAADVSFLAAMLVDKFCWHLPLYRQHQRLLDAGITLSRSTLVYWASRAIDLLAPITDAQSVHVLASQVLAMDETSLKAGRKAKGKMRTGWLWPVYGDCDEVVFHYAPSRAHRHVHEHLAHQGASRGERRVGAPPLEAVFAERALHRAPRLGVDLRLWICDRVPGDGAHLGVPRPVGSPRRYGAARADAKALPFGRRLRARRGSARSG